MFEGPDLLGRATVYTQLFLHLLSDLKSDELVAGQLLGLNEFPFGRWGSGSGGGGSGNEGFEVVEHGIGLWGSNYSDGT